MMHPPPGRGLRPREVLTGLPREVLTLFASSGLDLFDGSNPLKA